MQETWVQIPELGRSPGGGNGNLLHILVWEIPWTEESGGLQSVGSQDSDMTEHIPLLFCFVFPDYY